MTVKQQRTTPRWTGGLSLVVRQSKSSLPNLCTMIIMDVEVRFEPQGLRRRGFRGVAMLQIIQLQKCGSVLVNTYRDFLCMSISSKIGQGAQCPAKGKWRMQLKETSTPSFKPHVFRFGGLTAVHNYIHLRSL